MDQAGREVKDAVKALALAHAAPRKALCDAEKAVPDNSTVAFDVTVRVFGKIDKRHGDLSIDAVSHTVRENVEEPAALPFGGLRLSKGDHDDGEA